ncbi:MAG: amino acid adenylation domain-containing protein [Gemmatimonadota bacterium]|nr:amino acid adenylation domain-containing protein [Gemmatimonadota bacterium]
MPEATSTLVGRLESLLRDSAERWPDRTAVEDPATDESLTYVELDELSDRHAEALRNVGVRAGERVGLAVPKRVDTVAWVFGIMKAGAAYVPVDPDAPAGRSRDIFVDCSVRAIVSNAALADALATGAVNGSAVDSCWGERTTVSEDVVLLGKGGRAEEEDFADDAGNDALAYILYTSGSTGKPKGVMHSHSTARAFVDWCSGMFDPTEEDRFSSHAPFHFDLSIFDLYVAIKHGGAVVLIGETSGKSPLQLAEIASDREISVWYSTPTVLRLMIDYGRMEGRDFGHLRMVFFAGEVFPIGHLRRLKEIWTEPRFFNLYGPTETNVCTWYEVPARLPDDRLDPVPIGRPSSGDVCRVVDPSGTTVAPGEEGELVVAGGSVMLGYWSRPDRTAEATLVDAEGVSWYRTGDVVREDDGGDYVFLGRRDRMVKRRGYRVELGEIESALYRHDEIVEAAVVATPDDESGVLVTAFLTWSGEDKPSLIKLKQHCAQNLPAYMVPDAFVTVDDLPKTSTDKIDYQRLRADVVRS